MIALALLLAGCGQPEVLPRKYREVATRVEVRPAPPASPGAPAMAGDVPASGVELTWQTPEGWQEQPAGGMRLATFTVDDAECAITAFPGDVGGLQANLERWLGQLNRQAESPQAMEAFMASGVPVEGGLPGQWFDFSSWVGDDPSAPSMLAGVLEKGGSTVFVKLTGPQSVLAAQRGAFAGLCRSLR